MGPSGYGFLHPAAVASNDPLLAEFVAETVQAAKQLSMTSYVHWDIDDNGLTQRCILFPATRACDGYKYQTRNGGDTLPWFGLDHRVGPGPGTSSSRTRP